MLLLRGFGSPCFQQGGQDVKNTGNSGAAQVTLLPILPKKTRRNSGMTKPRYRGGLTVLLWCFSGTISFETAPVYPKAWAKENRLGAVGEVIF